MDNFTPPLFTGKSLSGLDGVFKSKLEAMAKAFREYVIQEKRKNWESIPISSAVRADREQAKAMVDLYRNRNKLADVYRNSPLSLPFLRIIDDIVLNDRISEETSGVAVKKANQYIQKAVQTLIATKGKGYSNLESASEALLMAIMASQSYGILSFHRDVSGGRCAVDVSSHYAHIRLLREFLKDSSKPWKSAFSMSEESAYGSNDRHLLLKG